MKKTLGFVATVLIGGCVASGGQESNEHVGEAAQAVLSNDVSAKFTLNGTTTTIQTGEMPADWFDLDTNRSPITVEWNMPPTDCRNAGTGSLSSVDTGAFIGVLGPSKTTPAGYLWWAGHNLADLVHHWHNHIACDGSVSVVGCSDARKVAYALSVWGSCLTAGGSCTAKGTVSLPAIQDADVIEENCTTNTDCEETLGSCISACQHECGPDNSDCHICCVCTCKNDNYDCGPPPPSCYNSNPSHPACLPTTPAPTPTPE